MLAAKAALQQQKQIELMQFQTIRVKGDNTDFNVVWSLSDCITQPRREGSKAKGEYLTCKFLQSTWHLRAVLQKQAF